MAKPQITKHLRITGRVQGVSYRAWTVRTATALNLTGWVRNRSDGSVEALVTGPENAVQELIAKCKTGPSFARVDHIESKEAEPENPGGFEQRPTL